jgi:hypothetical protein
MKTSWEKWRSTAARWECTWRSVDATVVNSPFEYRAEQKGFKVLLSIKETAESVKSDQRAEQLAAKIDRAR